MNTQKYVTTLKIFPTLLGLTSMSVLTSLPSPASQSSPLVTSSKQLIAEAEAPKELSPSALKVLCKNFPLNSRCTGASAETSPTPTDEPAAESAPTDTSVSEGEVPADSPAMSDAPDSDSTDTAADETEDAAEGGAEQTTPDPAASDAPTDDSMKTDDGMEGTAEGGAEQTTPDPAASDAPTDATTSDSAAPVMKAPTVTPPVVTPPTVTPPVSGPEGGEGGAEQSPASDAGATPTAPTEEAAPEETMPAETEQPSSSTPEATPNSDGLKPEADATQSSQSSISEAELQQFATAIPQLSSLEQSTKGEISQVIVQSGLSQDKFNALYNGQQTNDPSVEATDAEKQSFEQAMTKIQAIEKKGQAEQEKVIRSQGLEPQRFSQILAAVRQDQALRTKVQQMLQTN